MIRRPPRSTQPTTLFPYTTLFRSVASAKIKQIASAIAEQVDLDKLLALTQKAPLAAPHKASVQPLPCGEKVRIAIARDRAFGFYYADDLDALEAAGAELVPFDALNDAHLPPADGLYIGGGFPEACAVELEANASLRGEIAQAISAGLPTYAECGGLMYLSRSITDAGRSYAMVGAIPGDVTMHAKPIGRGYVHLKEDETHPWPRPDMPDRQIRAHEFHYSKLDNLPQGSRFAYHVERGYGIDGDRDGLVVNNLLASYTHLRTIGSCYWATRFVGFVRRCKEQREPISTLNERAS
jgi:cobyrinic acid a,c-diamide synthase